MDKKLILNKIFSLLFILSLYSCSAQTININGVVDTYIDYYSSKNRVFHPKETYLLIGLFSEIENPQNKILSLSNNCFECGGKITDKDIVVQYKGYKVLILSDSKENKTFLLKNFKNTKMASKLFVTAPIENLIIDPPNSWTVRYDDKEKIYFVCMGNKTEEIKKKLGLTNKIEDCQSQD